jgi:Restriction endonuclease
MADWKLYQDETAKLFRELGCDVETDFEVAGARGKHRVDVYVGFSRFGLRQHWIVECKYWKRAVPKEKVLALKAIVEDLGADRGVLVSESGHQSGALAVARHTNVTLASLDELRKGAREELLGMGLQEIQRRAMRMKDYIFSLWKTKRHESGFFTSEIRPDIDGKLATKIAGTVSIIGTGAERALVGTFPAPLRFLEDGNSLITAKDLEEFVVSASDILDSMDVLLAELRKQAESSP